MESTQITGGRGRPRETIKKYLEMNELDRNMVYDRAQWHHLIHEADPFSGIRLGYKHLKKHACFRVHFQFHQ